MLVGSNEVLQLFGISGKLGFSRQTRLRQMQRRADEPDLSHRNAQQRKKATLDDVAVSLVKSTSRNVLIDALCGNAIAQAQASQSDRDPYPSRPEKIRQSFERLSLCRYRTEEFHSRLAGHPPGTNHFCIKQVSSLKLEQSENYQTGS